VELAAHERSSSMLQPNHDCKRVDRLLPSEMKGFGEPAAGDASWEHADYGGTIHATTGACETGQWSMTAVATIEGITCNAIALGRTFVTKLGSGGSARHNL